MNSILLAAGLSRRMGTQKLLLPFKHSTVIETVIDNLKLAGLFPIYAVFSHEIAKALTVHHEWIHININPDPQRGQSSSLAVGLEMLPDGEDFCIMLGDLPCLSVKDILEISHKFQALQEGKTVLAPCRNGAFGHPMFYRAVWKERFKSAKGDTGGKNILFSYEHEIFRLEAPDGHFRDLDTPEDYKSLVQDN